MEKDILTKYKMNSREEAVKFLKSLITETPQPCPLCNGKLDYLHKKAKKSNCDWICTVCGERTCLCEYSILLACAFEKEII